MNIVTIRGDKDSFFVKNEQIDRTVMILEVYKYTHAYAGKGWTSVETYTEDSYAHLLSQNRY